MNEARNIMHDNTAMSIILLFESVLVTVSGFFAIIKPVNKSDKEPTELHMTVTRTIGVLSLLVGIAGMVILVNSMFS